MREVAEDLVRLISAAIAAHDPLDPWLVQSNYDEHYWDDIATQAAPHVAAASSESEVNEALAERLETLVELLGDEGYARDRIRAAAAEIWQHRPQRDVVVDAVSPRGRSRPLAGTLRCPFRAPPSCRSALAGDALSAMLGR
jgi:hypothetical protein